MTSQQMQTVNMPYSIVAAAVFVGGILLFFPHTSQGAHEVIHQDTQTTTLETMVVTADRLREFATNNPAMVEAVGRREIEQRNIRSVEEALGNMGGVEVKQTSGVGSRISIRGSGKTGGVLVLVNGRPINSNQYGGVDLSSIPIETIESITVFKPPVPVWLGTGASDGAISIVTRGITGTREAEQKQIAKIRAAAGSYGTVEGSVSGQGKLGPGTAMASATGKHRDGKRTNNDLDSGNLLLHWDGSFANNRMLELDGRYLSSEYGSPGPLDNPTPNARQSYKKASLDARFSGAVGADGDYALNVYGETIEVEDQSQSGMISTLDDDKLGMKGEYNWNDEADRWTVRTSGLVENDRLDHTFSGRHSRVTARLGLQVDRKWQDWIVTGGARGDQVSNFGLNPGLSTGIRYAFAEGWSLKANIGSSVNIPTFGQLYQPSHGSIDQVRGNPELNKEKILSADTGVEYTWDKAQSVQLSMFRTETVDPILYQRGSDLIYRPINGDKAWRHGLEATWKYSFAAWLSLDANLIVQDSEIRETGNQLTYTPHLKGKLTLQSTLPRTETRLETSVRYTGRQHSEMENRKEQQLDSYVSVDCKIIQPFTLSDRKVEWFLNINNLFDTGYEIHYGYPDEGFFVLSGLNVSF